MVGSMFGEIHGFSAASPLVFRVELNFTRSICVFLTYYMTVQAMKQVQFLNTNYKDVGKFVEFDISVLKHQEALEKKF